MSLINKVPGIDDEKRCKRKHRKEADRDGTSKDYEEFKQESDYDPCKRARDE